MEELGVELTVRGRAEGVGDKAGQRAHWLNQRGSEGRCPGTCNSKKPTLRAATCAETPGIASSFCFSVS